MNRCGWVNLNNDLYVKYHDEEWGNPLKDDNKLYELFILETFQAGLSWECILNKRDNFREAYDNFDIDKVINYDQDKINGLLNNKGIIRNRRKILASINNSIIFKDIQKEFGSFSNYIWGFNDGKIIYDCISTTSFLSDLISKDLSKRGMTFVGSTTIHSFLQATGIINAHMDNCFLNKKNAIM